MSNPIILPPLPEPRPFALLTHEVLVRELEVARLVLEAAADFMEMEGFGGYAIAIRALEVRHHE